MASFFLIQTHGEEALEKFNHDFHPNINFSLCIVSYKMDILPLCFIENPQSDAPTCLPLASILNTAAKFIICSQTPQVQSELPGPTAQGL